ncbi:MAG: hypothetical protein WBZ39_07825, partial [Methylovirgula sp.]
LNDLKDLRHETYHVVLSQKASEVIGQLNWAEELHAAIGDHIRKFVKEGQAKEFVEWRRKHKAPSLHPTGNGDQNEKA